MTLAGILARSQALPCIPGSVLWVQGLFGTVSLSRREDLQTQVFVGARLVR